MYNNLQVMTFGLFYSKKVRDPFYNIDNMDTPILENYNMGCHGNHVFSPSQTSFKLIFRT